MIERCELDSVAFGIGRGASALSNSARTLKRCGLHEDRRDLLAADFVEEDAGGNGGVE